MANDKTNTPDTELLDLCRQVFKATMWVVSDYPSDWFLQQLPDTAGSIQRVHPIYNSDFLLGKLPVDQKRYNGYMSKAVIGLQLIRKGTAFDQADYWEASYWKSPILYQFADTPLKALLRLTIKMHKEGLL